MGLFSGTPSDFEPVRETVRKAAQQIHFASRGLESDELLYEYVEKAKSEMLEMKRFLLANGRAADVRKLQKKIMSDATYLDNGTYNRVYAPLVWGCLED